MLVIYICLKKKDTDDTRISDLSQEYNSDAYFFL